jgi:hypothetical protein
MTQLEFKPTKDEQSYVDAGGRVLFVEPTESGLWQVMAMTKNGYELILKPDDAEGYVLIDEAMENAHIIMAISEDHPLICTRAGGKAS